MSFALCQKNNRHIMFSFSFGVNILFFFVINLGVMGQWRLVLLNSNNNLRMC